MREMNRRLFKKLLDLNQVMSYDSEAMNYSDSCLHLERMNCQNLEIVKPSNTV